METAAQDWPQFRGPNGNGVAAGNNAPLHWSPTENIRWRTELPGPGNSSPIVSGNKVFISCATAKGTRRGLYAFDRSTGKSAWQQVVEFPQLMPTHKTNPYAASTPAADGRRVVVWHGSAGLHCYDFNGKPLWSRDLGEFRHMWGYASSPVIYQDRVILHAGPGKEVFVGAFDLETGETVWKTPEPVEGTGERNDDGEYMGSWSTPIITEVDGRDQVICAMATRVNGYDPATGELLWYCRGLRGRKGDLSYSSPIIAGDVAVVVGGFNGPSLGFKPGGSGNITDSRRLWVEEPNPQNIGSGIHVAGAVYVPDAGPGLLRCLDPKTGELRWQQRMDANFWGSIVKAGNRLYVTDQQGKTVVFAPNSEQFEQLAVNPLNEPSNSTPAIADGQMYIRTVEALYCIGEE